MGIQSSYGLQAKPTNPYTAAGIPANNGSQALVDQFAQQLTQQHGFPGAIVYSASPNGSAGAASGVADLQTRRPLNENTPFPIGSVTKLYTSTLILQLAQEGKLKLTDPVNQYLPEDTLKPLQADPKSPLTIQDLLMHRSGLPQWSNKQVFRALYFHQKFPDYRLHHKDLIHLADNVPATAQRGDYEYNNVNFELLGSLAEAVTNKPLSALYQERIFDRLGLTSTTYGCSDPTLKTANGYASFLPNGLLADETSEDNAIFSEAASGGIISTVKELDIFMRALFEGQLLTPTYTNILKNTSTLCPDGSAQGLGVFLDLGNAPTYWHNGGTFGSQSYVAYNPTTRKSLIVLANRGSIGEPGNAFLTPLVEQFATEHPECLSQ